MAAAPAAAGGAAAAGGGVGGDAPPQPTWWEECQAAAAAERAARAAATLAASMAARRVMPALPTEVWALIMDRAASCRCAQGWPFLGMPYSADGISRVGFGIFRDGRSPPACWRLTLLQRLISCTLCSIHVIKCIFSYRYTRDAAALACLCRAAAAAPPTSKWHSAVRIGLSGAVLEPSSGTFDVTVAPGEDVQATVNRCPPGGCVLLQPGTHTGPLVLVADKVVHVFGRGSATLQSATRTVLTSSADAATVDGLILRREAGDVNHYCVKIKSGRLRLQACDITNTSHVCIGIEGGADPVVILCKYVGGFSLPPRLSILFLSDVDAGPLWKPLKRINTD